MVVWVGVNGIVSALLVSVEANTASLEICLEVSQKN